MEETLELYVWPGVSDLVSIDAECIAIIYFLRYRFSNEQNIAWRITSTHDPTIIPTNSLPTLKHGTRWFHGFRNISRHLTSPGLPAFKPDSNLDPSQHAESLALAHHLQNTAQPLLDYHLYINGSNYSSITHEAYRKWLPFPLGWLYPSYRRSRAVRRAKLIGLDKHTQLLEKDRDDAPDTEDPAGGHLENSTTPSLLFARSQRAQKTLRERANATRFRLQAAVDAMCEPLDEILVRRQDEQLDGCLFGRVWHSVDWLVYGYLTIMFKDGASDDSIRQEIQSRWPQVASYYDWLPYGLDGREAGADRPESFILQAPPSPGERVSYFLTAVMSLFIPQSHQTYSTFLCRTLSLTTPLLVLGIFGASTSFATITYAIRTLLAPKTPRDAPNQRDIVFARAKTRLSQLGESGAALAALLGPISGPFDGSGRMPQERTEAGGLSMTQEVRRIEPQNVEVAEVDVEVENR